MCLELKDFALGKIQLIKSFARPYSSYFHDQSKQAFKVIAA